MLTQYTEALIDYLDKKANLAFCMAGELRHSGDAMFYASRRLREARERLDAIAASIDAAVAKMDGLASNPE